MGSTTDQRRVRNQYLDQIQEFVERVIVSVMGGASAAVSLSHMKGGKRRLVMHSHLPLSVADVARKMEERSTDLRTALAFLHVEWL